MSRTYRNIPHNHAMRRPQYKWKLSALGVRKKWIVTDYDDKPIAGLKENKHHNK